MYSLSKASSVVSCVLCIAVLAGCQSTTGKTAGQTMSDVSISTAVQTKLSKDRLSNFSRIDVDTERGVVNLSGIVETEAQRAQATHLAQQVEGVVKVNNNLQIQNRPSGKPSLTPQAHDMKSGQVERPIGSMGHKEMASPEQGIRVIQGEVLRVEGQNYFVKGLDGKEVRFHADTTTMKTEKIQAGDRIEAKVNDDDHAVSLLPAP
ncbi:MAG: BON domain-containing protein [Nitrospiraceae bacterium]